ncbi:MAG TPA: response regulator [Chloroflexota bacterium]|jgi:CheY-like chemotaxis protein
MDAAHRRILVVEDDEAVRALLTELLAEAGYAVRAANDGPAGLELLRDWRPDAIVLDIALPGMDGWAFRTAQRRVRGAVDIPVVVVSGGHRIVAPSPELIPAAVVPKPFDVDELLATVARLVAHRPLGGRRDGARV